MGLENIPHVLFLIALVVVGGLGFATTTEEQRKQLFGTLRIVSRIPIGIARHNRGECAAYLDTLRAQMRFPLVTLAIVALNVIVFILMIFGRGSLGNPETLVGWGANFGPRTTNGEWWRLVVATFIHSGFIAFAVNIGALAQLGFVLERVAGRLAFATVYMLAGILAGLVSLAAHPIVVSAGASGAIAGIYGL